MVTAYKRTHLNSHVLKKKKSKADLFIDTNYVYVKGGSYLRKILF